VKLKLTSMECVAKSGDELAAEDTAEHADRRRRNAGRRSIVSGPGKAACGKYAVDVRMKPQALIPAVEHAEEADLGPKMPGIAGYLKQGLGTGVKEQVEDEPLVL